MTAKFSLAANPTFPSVVDFERAGNVPSIPVNLTFKHRTKDELDKFINERGEKTDVQFFLEMVSTWDLEEPLNSENVQTLLQNHPPNGVIVFKRYISDLLQAKAKN